MRRIARFRLALWSGCLAACFASAQPAQDAALLQQAGRLFAAHDLEPAEQATRRYLNDHPGSAPAMFLLGRILEGRKRPEESLQWFTRAAAVARPTGEDLRVVAMDYVLLGAYPDALRWLRKSVELDPANAEAWYGLGRTLMTQGDLHSARAPLERALALRPKQAKVENNLGVIAEGEGRAAEAEALYRKAIAWQQDDASPSEQPYLNLGVLLLTQQQGAAALPLLERAALLAPRDPRSHEQLARAEADQGRTAEAVAELLQAVALEPQSAQLHFELGQAYRRAGEAVKARQELTLAGQLYGTHSTDQNH